jgi:hypothetical protein
MTMNSRNKSSILRLPVFGLSILILILVSILALATPSYATTIANEDIKWSDEGSTYRLTQTDNTFTERDYTVKVVEFPAAVRGYKTINGSVYPERPVVPFVKFELYKDIINNTSPIDNFTIGVGEEYVFPDQETRITISDIPGSMSQDWVYEYYNPWVTIETRTRSIPNLDISISLTTPSGDDVDLDNIRSGSDINARIDIKNTGNDYIENVMFNINPGQLLLRNMTANYKLADTIYRLYVNDEKIIDVSLTIPVSLEEKAYDIQVNTTGQDVKGVVHNFNVSTTINVKSETDAISVEKRLSKNTSYLTEYMGVVLSIVNAGHTTISNIQIHDAVPSGLTFVKDGIVQNYTEFSLIRSSLGPSESWTIGYSLRPKEPGIYILPQFSANFSIGDKNLSATAGEVGFRVFGPHVVLTKSARSIGNGIVDVIVTATNVGNGPTKAVIEDYTLPSNTTLISGEETMTVSLDPDVEKVMNYTIRSYETNISKLIWSPAVATYYLDDWRFNTTSDEKYDEGHIVGEDRPLEGGVGAHVIILAPSAEASAADDGSTTAYPEVTVPQVQEEQKQVVATIPAETPAPTAGKSIPGFVSYELVLLLAIIFLIKKTNAGK